jgi:hypothetical protein
MEKSPLKQSQEILKDARQQAKGAVEGAHHLRDGHAQ